MNNDNLHELINRYEEKIPLIYSEEHHELFKWKAMKVWREEWYKPEDAFPSFVERFNAARKEFLLFQECPENDMVKSTFLYLFGKRYGIL